MGKDFAIVMGRAIQIVVKKKRYDISGELDNITRIIITPNKIVFGSDGQVTIFEKR